MLAIGAGFPCRVFIFGERRVKVLWDKQIRQLTKLTRTAARCVILVDVTAVVGHNYQSAPAVPRRFVPPWVVAVGYGSVAFLVAPLFNVLIMSVAAAATGDKTYLEMPLRAHGGWAFGISFLSYIAVTVLFGLWLTHRQRRKIEAEHARVADLDRKIALESPDEATD